ncbi:hypothetical protein, conserved [Eimeria necatrix]|uniref:Uncharacterized protein n=1 Tax=Eimeria necatrix TaxID=51315 RepID=U6MS27_9EIME|nr:hypothetical protein, conserved [Eimeria necatrix]CDJ66816.1 hypothetical protein, conserved [Eimeria necatrix]
MRALRALTLVLSCGLYKYNGEIVHMLAGWRDPNIVPIKSLYEVTTIRNYFAELLADRSPLVRMFFFDTVGYWLLNLQDKADYETWLFPYLLSGLFDSFRPIQQLVFLLLEQLGRHYEQLHEKDLREIKQLGTPDLWSYGGKAFLSFPLGGCWAVSGAAKAREEAQQFAAFVSSYTERLQSLGIEGFSLVEKKQNQLTVPGEELVGDPPRPCLGARTMVRIYFRRFAKTLFQSVSDFKEVSQTASARLLVVSFAFIEEAAVEWLDSCFAICCRVLAAPQQHATAAVESHRVALQLLGAFADPENYWEVAKEALRENVLQELQVQVATLSSLALMLQGSFMVLKKAADPSLGLGRLGPVLPEIAQALSSSHLLQEPYLRFAAEGLTQLVQVLVSGVRGQNETLSEETWHHLLSVTCCLAAPPRCLEGAENSQLQPQLQQLMTDLACCRKATRRMPQPHSDAATLWASVDILRGIPPANLAALSTYIIHLPSCRLLEEKTFQVLFGKLQQCAAATEEAATRRSCRRAALRLVMRLAQLGAASSSSSTDAGTQMPQQKCPAASPTAVSRPSSSGVAGTAVATTAAADSSSGAELQNGEDEESEPVRKLLDCPVAAAAGVLQQLLLRLLQQVECAEDAQDALAALTELLTLPGLDNVNWGEAVQQLLLLSGLSQDLARFLGCPFLHTKLFRSACMNYAHHSAATYPDKNPGAVLEEMPLGKRRELRLAALRAAAELKQQAVLLLRLCLPMLAEDRNSLSALVYGTFAALQPPSKLQKRPDACKMGCCDAAKEHGGTAANAAADGAAGTAADGAAGTPADAAADGAARAAADVAGDTAAGNVADAAADAAEDAHAGAVAAAAADSAAEAPANAAAEAAAGGAATAAADSAADIAAGRSSDTDNQPNANEIERTNEEEAEGKEEVCSFAQCTVSLPFEAQSPWLLFQIASCLFDTISLWIVPERGLPNEEEGLRKSKQVFEMCSPDSLLMPRLLALPMYSHLERLHANRRLLELLSESCLCQAVDSCVRQILDLKGSFSEGFEAYLEAPEGPPGAPSGAPKTLKEAVAAAKKQAAAVSLETQKMQAIAAITQLLKLFGIVCPSALQECLRQYEARGRFSRWELLSRIFKDTNGSLSDN